MQMCPDCGDVYDESEYAKCPNCHPVDDGYYYYEKDEEEEERPKKKKRK